MVWVVGRIRVAVEPQRFEGEVFRRDAVECPVVHAAESIEAGSRVDVDASPIRLARVANQFEIGHGDTRYRLPCVEARRSSR